MFGLIAIAQCLVCGLGTAHSWSQESPDGKYLLVMISPVSEEVDIFDYGRDANEQRRQLRTHYKQCGLYRNDGSQSPLWTLPYRGCDLPFVLNDGQHVILADEHWYRSHNHVATFYSDGNKLASHQLEKLAGHYQFTVRWLYWPECQSVSLDEGRLQLTVKTNQGETFVFDVATGKVIRSSSRYPRLIAIACIVLFGVPLMSAMFYFAARKRVAAKKTPTPI